MKKIVLLISGIILFSACWLIVNQNKNRPATPAGLFIEREVDNEASDDLERSLEEEKKLLIDPHTGTIPAGIREIEMEQAREIYRQTAGNARTQASSYVYQGPANLGGRTRSIAFDVSDATSNTIIAGSVSGGVFKTINGGSSWTRVNPANQNFTVTTIAQDPRAGNQNIWYYAGGEPTGNSASGTGAPYAGNGIYKSVDNGNTWSLLASSNTGSLFSFDNRADFILRIAVNPMNGDVYAACVGQIIRSQNGGATWAAVQTSTSFSNTNQFADVQITSTGRVYTAFSGTTSNGSNSVDGVWSSATGDAGDFTRIAGTGAATNPAGWNAYGAYGRVVLGLTPSNANLVYAMYYNNTTSSCTGTPAPEAEFYLWDQSAGSWTDLSATLPDETGCSNGNDPFAVQGGYDMVIAVKPNDANTIVIGGTNVYRSINGGASWTRIGGYAGTASYALYTNHHPDIHALVFKPSDATKLVTGDDGGIQTGDITATPVVWTPLNNNYQTYQYYHVAIKQEAGVNDFIGGAQDNGTTVSIGGSSSFSSILGADGVAVGLGAGAAPYKQYCGSQSGTFYRRNSAQGANFVEATLTPPGVASIFVTYFHLDPDNTENLYYAGQVSGVNKLLRITNASTATSASWQTFAFGFTGYIRTIATTRGTYTTSSRLYAGTDLGRVYRIVDPVNADITTTTPTDITPTGMAGLGTVISIAVNPQNQDEILVLYSNYGIVNAWHTTTAGDASPTWTNVEGNLTLPSYRSAMIVKNGASTEYFVGTSVGLYKTTLINGSSTVWAQESASQIGNSLVTSLSLRTADNTFAVGTHGSGMWKGLVTQFPLPVTFTSFTGQLIDNSSHLRWSTATEIKNKGFEVQRSYDGVRFESIGFVRAVPGGGNNYTFRDKDIAQNENYFRLKQLDIDGNEHFTSVVLIRNKSAASSSLTVLQNPFNSYLDLQLPGVRSSEVFVRLIDMNGKLIYQQRLAAAQQKLRLNFESVTLSSGAYLLQVIDGEKQYSTKVIKK